jgi:putative heme-binding domain-containing protein
MIQGGRYLRQGGSHFNEHTYADIQTIADHLHWQGADPWAGNNRSDSTGGGHAHCGLMIYQGNAWPEEYRGKVFMGNIHGHRFNMDILKPKGSGFVASHGPDFILANDQWARFINLQSGPDGNVYFLDWYDKQACHTGDVNIWDRTNGRIYKVSYRGTKPVTVDLSKKSDKELVELQLDKNEWFVRHARRILQERAANNKLDAGTVDALAKIAFENKDETRRLRGLWALHATGGLSQTQITRALGDESPYVRAWTIQLALENTQGPGAMSAPSALLTRMIELAVKDPSPVVRLYVASGLQRLKPEDRWEIAKPLVSHGEDAADANLPLMYWYAVEPLADADNSRALELAAESKIPLLLPFMARRLAFEAKPEALALIAKRLAHQSDPKNQLTILGGVYEGLKGRRQVPMPKEWPDAFAKLSRSKDGEVRAQAMALAVTFGDPTAFADLRKVLASRESEAGARQSALTALLGAKDKDLPPLLLELVKEPALRGAAIRGLATYNATDTPAVLLAAYASLNAAEKRDALNTLASRAAYGKALMDAIADKKLATSDVPAEVVRQLRVFGDKDLEKRINEVWGLVRSTPADRAKLIADWKKKLNAAAPPPDLMLGRAVFAKTCQQCHTLYGVGGKVGPDITGSNRPNLDYLLENVFDPSAVIPNDYRATRIDLKNGRVVTGIIRGETQVALTVVTANETLTIPVNEIDTRTLSEKSMMPDDLLQKENETEVRALFAYLRHTSQVPMLATHENAKDFFNGKDLSGWDGDAKLWSVENGEIVGKSPGIPKNEFLKSHIAATDFRLTLKIKLVPNKENSGVQFRSEALPDGEMKGPQADAGLGWWGKLYEENGRGVLSDNKSGEKIVKADEWNEYEIIAEGNHVRTFINGKPCVDLTDADLSRRGVFGLQIHAGGSMEVRFKDLKFEVLPPAKRDADK